MAACVICEVVQHVSIETVRDRKLQLKILPFWSWGEAKSFLEQTTRRALPASQHPLWGPCSSSVIPDIRLGKNSLMNVVRPCDKLFQRMRQHKPQFQQCPPLLLLPLLSLETPTPITTAHQMFVLSTSKYDSASASASSLLLARQQRQLRHLHQHHRHHVFPYLLVLL